MVRAVLKGGVIVPLGPLPVAWREGTELTLEAVDEPTPSPEEADAWARELEALCADSDPAEEEQLQAFLDERRRAGKTEMRRQMGCPNGPLSAGHQSPRKREG